MEKHSWFLVNELVRKTIDNPDFRIGEWSPYMVQQLEEVIKFVKSHQLALPAKEKEAWK